MNKILYVLMLLALLVSCSSDNDDIDPNSNSNNGNGNNNGMIDEKILGKWKVEYSKNIYTFFPNAPVSADKYYKIFEYDGSYDGTENSIPQAGFFIRKEISIEFTKEGDLIINHINNQSYDSVKEESTTTTYKVSNDSIQLTGNYPLKAKYHINGNNELIIENSYSILKDDPQYNSEFLTEKEGVVFSKYSKIKE